MSKNVLLTVEALGEANNSLILSIGGVAFDRFRVHETFYSIVNGESCLKHNLAIDYRSLCWWMDRDNDTRSIFQLTASGVLLEDALRELTQAFDWRDTLVWNGEHDRDALGLLEHAYNAVGQKAPWAFYNTRCYKTWADEHSLSAENADLSALSNYSNNALSHAQRKVGQMIATNRHLQVA